MLTPFLLSDCMMSYFFMVINLVVLSGQGFDSEQLGLEVDPDKKVYNMSVSEKQTVEILKVLYRGAKILILDEPTAVLTPQETEKLFAILKKMKAQGCAIIIITHKLHEVMPAGERHPRRP